MVTHTLKGGYKVSSRFLVLLIKTDVVVEIV
jgi:hypothetical protein